MDPRALRQLLDQGEFTAWTKVRRDKWRNDLSFIKAWKAAHYGSDAEA